MKQRRRIAGILAPLTLALITAQACGPDFEPDVFVRKLRPDHPADYAAGKLGILLPTYPRADLMVAFRYLNGGSLSPAERLAHSPVYDIHESDPTPAESVASTQGTTGKTQVESWAVLRATYAPAAAGVSPDRQIAQEQPGGWVWHGSYENCYEDAFRTAALTLKSRARTWGEKSADLADWIKGQDAVFSNCASPNPNGPADTPATASTLLKQDRAYQQAAAAMYADRFPQAIAGFEVIGHDSTSPWQSIAPYLAARCLVRQAFLLKAPSQGTDTASFDEALMRQAAMLLEALLKDPHPGQPTRAIQNELDLVRLRIEPTARVRELSTALAGPATDAEFHQHLQDLNWYLNAHLDEIALREDANVSEQSAPQDASGLANPKERDTAFSAAYEKLASLPAPSALVDWLIAFQSPAPEAKDHAIAEWRKTKRLYWLEAAITKATAKDAATPELIQAAEEVKPDSPAWESLTYHRIRLTLDRGQTTQARSLLAEITPRIQAGGRESSINAFTGLRMRASNDLGEFLTFAPRQILVRSSESQYSVDECLNVMKDPKRVYDCKEEQLPDQFSVDAAHIFNAQMPLDILVQAAQSTVLPPHLRRSVAIAAWVRSVLLKNDQAAAKLLPLLPAKVQSQAGAGTGFHAVVTIVRNPGLRPFLDPGVQRSEAYDFIESYRDNWWDSTFETNFYDGSSRVPVDNGPLPFLTEAQRTEGSHQYAELISQGNPQIYLGNQILAYAKAHFEDPDVPEALYLILRMNRYGYADYAATDTSAGKAQSNSIDEVRKGAARLLRQHYAGSPWTKKAAPFAG